MSGTMCEHVGLECPAAGCFCECGRCEAIRRDEEPGTETDRTPWQADRDRVEATGKWPPSWGPFHRHFANDAVHRDGGPECDQPGTPRRVYVFDADTLDEHERIVARYAAQHPDEFREDAPAPVLGQGETE